MFEKLRKMIFPIIFIVLFFFVAMIFLQWGLDFSGRGNYGGSNNAGTVNGEAISWNVYQQTYNNLLEQESKGGQVEVPETRTKQLEQSAWQQLVHDKLIMQQAAKHNIVVTDQEVFAYLLLSPPQYMQQVQAFQTNGQFDYEKYKAGMADPKASPFWASLEPGVRSDLIRLKMQESIIQTAQVTESEVKQAFLDDNEKVKVGYIEIPYLKYMARVPNPDEAAMRKYYDEHKEEYKMDERAELKVAMVEKGATETDWQEAQGRIQIIRDSIAAGADFVTMAKTYSQDNSASEGGDLGWFNQAGMIPEFSRVIFAMKPGELSQPFRTQFGWHVAKLLEYRSDPNAKSKPGTAATQEAHASHILIRAVPSQASMDNLYRKMQEFRTAATESGFEKAATDTTIKVQMTGTFTRQASIPLLAYDPMADTFAFTSAIGAISDVMETNSAYYVAQVTRRLPAGIAEFDEARAQISRDLTNKTLAGICHDTAVATLAAARTSSDLTAIAARHGLEYKESAPFTRNGYLPSLGRDPSVIGAAFSAVNTGDLIGPVDYNQGAVIMKLLERQPADLTVYNEKRDSLANVVRSGKQQMIYSRWVEDLFKTSKIESNINKGNANPGS
ncbi:MAG: peptidyl-prolyl cis-trans isomerase [Candidatus Zixiibacteriota bacterium]